MLDLSFGLPIVVRDAALKMIAPGPNSEVNREYYAQEHEKEIEEGRGAVETNVLDTEEVLASGSVLGDVEGDLAKVVGLEGKAVVVTSLVGT